MDFAVLAQSARRGGANGLHRFLPSVPLPHRENLLRELSLDDWAAIVERSSLASITNTLDDLTHHPLGQLGSKIARDLASTDLAKPLRSARIGILGRFLRNLQTLAPDLCGPAGEQVARLDIGALLNATL